MWILHVRVVKTACETHDRGHYHGGRCAVTIAPGAGKSARSSTTEGYETFVIANSLSDDVTRSWCIAEVSSGVAGGSWPEGPRCYAQQDDGFVIDLAQVCWTSR